MIVLDAAALAARLDRRALIDALDAAFRRPSSVPQRLHYPLRNADGGGTGTLLVMPAWRSDGALGVKLVTVFPDNAARGLPTVSGSYLLFDGETGQPRALLDGSELTLRRTAAASALAARHLAAPAASRLLMVGTGRLAPHLIASHALVRPIREVRVWGRRPDQARAVAAAACAAGLDVRPTSDLEAAVRWADIVSCATLSCEPLVRGAWLAPGQHLDLVGAFTPQMCEADDEAVRRAELFVDVRAGALQEAGEITGAIARGIIDAAHIRAQFGDLAQGSFKSSGAQALTLFKSVGTALEDLVAAELALQASGPVTPDAGAPRPR
jgi:ornithine cyclodeaminase